MYYLYCYCLSDQRCMSLGDILQFFSGQLPAAGFDATPTIGFTCTPPPEGRLPCASTCALSITFPCYLGLFSYDEFQAKMDLSILESFGFGSV